MNLILTGLPRSGTTLVCHLLNQTGTAVALSEPMFPVDYAALEGDAIVDAVEAFFDRQRASLLESGTAVSRVKSGQVLDNSFGSELNPEGLRLNEFVHDILHVTTTLPPDFPLLIKHPAFFTAILPLLTRRFACFATVRNPLAVLLSWRSVDMPIQSGRIPMAEQFDPALADFLAGEPDCLVRQLHILSWAFARYESCLPRGQVLPYEELMATGGRSLKRILPGLGAFPAGLAERNTNPVYDRKVLGQILPALLASEGAHWNFYSREEVESLARRLHDT